MRHEKGARAAGRHLGRRPRLDLPARLPAQLVPVRGLPGPRPGGALPRPPRPGAHAPRGRRQLRARPHLGGRPQHRHLQLPDAARPLPLRRRAGARSDEAGTRAGCARFAAGVAVLYAVLSAALFTVMRQPSGRHRLRLQAHAVAASSPPCPWSGCGCAPARARSRRGDSALGLRPRGLRQEVARAPGSRCAASRRCSSSAATPDRRSGGRFPPSTRSTSSTATARRSTSSTSRRPTRPTRGRPAATSRTRSSSPRRRASRTGPRSARPA